MHSSLSRESQPDPARPFLSVPPTLLPPSVMGKSRLEDPLSFGWSCRLLEIGPGSGLEGHIGPGVVPGSCASSVWSLIPVCVDEGTGHSTVGRSNSWRTSSPDPGHPSTPQCQGLLCPFDRHRLGSLGTRPLPSAPSGISTSQPESRPVTVSTPGRVAANETAPHPPPCV